MPPQILFFKTGVHWDATRKSEVDSEQAQNVLWFLFDGEIVIKK